MNQESSQDDLGATVANPPIARMVAEHKPRWVARPMDFNRWKKDIRAMAKLLPAMDTATSTALGVAIAFAIAWIGEQRSARPDTLQLNLYGVATIASMLVTAVLAYRNTGERHRLVREAERICVDIDETVEVWNEDEPATRG